MTDTVRTRSYLSGTSFPSSKSGGITAQDIRDFVASTLVISTAAGAPASAPASLFEMYQDSTTKTNWYLATATAASTDWKQVALWGSTPAFGINITVGTTTKGAFLAQNSYMRVGLDDTTVGPQPEIFCVTSGGSLPSGSIKLIYGGGNNSGVASPSTSGVIFANFSLGVSRNDLQIDNPGNIVIGPAAIATTATDGFLYIPTCAGAPTGTPTTYTGRSPVAYDTTDNKLYAYNGGWKSVTLA